jgi:hypothetical protein
MVKKLLQRGGARAGTSARAIIAAGCEPGKVAAQRQTFRQLLSRKPDLDLGGTARGHALNCTLPAIHYVLEKMGLTYKKRHSGPANKTGPTLPGRGGTGAGSKESFDPARLIFLDESRRQNQSDPAARAGASAASGCMARPRTGTGTAPRSSGRCGWTVPRPAWPLKGRRTPRCSAPMSGRCCVRSCGPGDLVVMDNLAPCTKASPLLALIRQNWGQMYALLARLLPGPQPDRTDVEQGQKHAAQPGGANSGVACWRPSARLWLASHTRIHSIGLRIVATTLFNML